MKILKPILFLLSPLAFFLLEGCEVEFSPNAEWKNVPVVYCLLDQDDDTTWVRVERCYLGEGSIYSYSSIRDSVIYPQGSISVALLAYKDGTLKDSLPFIYTTRDRDSGSFASDNMPLYYCYTKNRLNQDYSYVLNVRKADGTLLVTTNPISLIKWKATADRTSPITKPTYNTYLHYGEFSFNGTGSAKNTCEIEWDTLSNARRYQPMVRFYYRVGSDTTYVDLMCPSTVSTVSSSRLSVLYPRETFLDDLKNKLKDDPSYKVNLNKVDVYLLCCTEEMNAYMSSVSHLAYSISSREVYNNIKGGVGIFAARRRHIYKSLPFEYNIDAPEGITYKIEHLGINMH